MDSEAHGHRAKRRHWRLATPVVGAVVGALFVISAANSEGTDLRPGRVNDLPSLVRSEKSHNEKLTQKAADLNAEVEKLSARVDDAQVRKVRARATALEGPAGFTEIHGEGVTVTLSDSPEELREGAEDIRRLVVHQQDIQAVVNAMWKAGAEGVMIQGQRIISTTGIKCVGNSVELQGIPYPQPYVITAVGDPEALQASIGSDYSVGLYRSDAANPAIQIGWELEVDDDVTVPAYDGLRNLEYAETLD